MEVSRDHQRQTFSDTVIFMSDRLFIRRLNVFHLASRLLYLHGGNIITGRFRVSFSFDFAVLLTHC